MIPKYLSAEEYSRKSGLGVAEVKKQIRNKEISAIITSGGHYKIKVFEEAVSRDIYEKTLEEKNKLEEKLENIMRIIN